MLIKSFLQWLGSAPATQRAKAAAALSRAYAQNRLAEGERTSAEAAFGLLLDDPSPKVRLALAEGLASSVSTPRAIVAALAEDQIEVASRVVALSPVLTDGDLVDLVATGPKALQAVVAYRAHLSVPVAAALAEIGGSFAIKTLLDNPGAQIADVSIRRIAERFGDHTEIRTTLIGRANLPSDVRQQLVLKVGEALSSSSLVAGTIGSARVKRVTDEACLNATLKMAASVDASELPALAEHLRISAQMTPSFLMHTLITGNVDFFAAAIVSLTGFSENRVRSILVDGRRHAMTALYEQAGIERDIAAVFVSATLLWRGAHLTKASADPTVITEQLIREFSDAARTDAAISDLLMLVSRQNLAFVRQSARSYAETLAQLQIEAA